jgi:hypothetical protein
VAHEWGTTRAGKAIALPRYAFFVVLEDGKHQLAARGDLLHPLGLTQWPAGTKRAYIVDLVTHNEIKCYRYGGLIPKKHP